MKIRNGFVTNSSSSSYVIIGVRLNNEKARELLGITDAYGWDKVLEEHGLDLENPYDNYDDNIIGINISRASEELVESSYFSIQEKINKGTTKLKELGVAEEDIKVYHYEGFN